ncbi:MAG: hypothetical protein JNM76_16665 [Betaproteobacteria bacterium]|nr:hypothetical protein [Betaproteobacteria bacterium]
MAKTWAQKLAGGQPPHVDVLEKAFAGLKPGQTLFIASPRLVADEIAKLPAGKAETVAAFRQRLAKRNKADATCPLSTGIFIRIAAEAAWDEILAGKPLSAVTPFWRLVEPGSALAARLRCGDDFLEAQRAAEGMAP